MSSLRVDDSPAEPFAWKWPEPKVIDVMTLKTQGLIRVDGDRMTYIVSNPGGPRPAGFDTNPGDGLTKVTLRRVR